MRTLPPCTIILFGATGDLARKKLFPALHKLHGELHEKTRIIAVGRRDYDDAGFRSEFVTACDLDKKGVSSFCKRILYHRLDFDEKEGYVALQRKLNNLDPEIRDRRIVYLATAPEAFTFIAEQLTKNGIAVKNPKHGWHRIVIEKPFGHDLTSARNLNKRLSKRFHERQMYRIDHYLGKEFVQNIMALRFTNPLFNRLWSHEHIDNVQIVANETATVGTRGGYYDTSGALRDMLQSHLLQMLAITTMEEPRSLSPDEIRGKKLAILKAISRDAKTKKSIVLGQYRAGVINGIMVPDYTAEPGVAKRSRTETFAAMRLTIKNKRWSGVPFYLRTGKALMHHYAEVVVTFKPQECKLFCDIARRPQENILAVRIQPDQGVELRFNLKDPENEHVTLPLSMEYSRAAEFGENSKEAYERLLGDVMVGDQTLFTRWDEVEESWKIVDALRVSNTKIHLYDAGTHGPDAARKLLTDEKREWFGNRSIQCLHCTK